MMGTRGRILGGGLAACLALAAPCIAWYEGTVTHTYTDIVGIPTICDGHTGPDVKPGMAFTESECAAVLQKDMAVDVNAVLDCVHVDLQPWEAAALVSFVHNVGKGALCGSTLAKYANAGAPATVWCPRLRDWTYAHKMGIAIQLPGLVKRRASEEALCLGSPLSTLGITSP